MNVLLAWLLLMGTVEAAEVVLTVPDPVLADRLATARAWRHCAPDSSDTACLTTLMDKVMSFLTLGHDANLDAVGGTLEVRR